MKTSKGLSAALRISGTIAMLAMVLVSLAVYHTNVGGLLLFLAFILFWVLVPGLLVTRLIGFKSGHMSADLLVSFFAGWFLIVVEYFITQAIGSNMLLYTAGLLCSAAYIWLIAARRREPLLMAGKFSFKRVPASFFLFMALLMGYVFMFTQFQYLAPQYADNVHVSLDKAYQMCLIGSLSHGYPLVDPLVAGKLVHYHIFSQILLAVPVMLFGMSPDFLVMSCTPYLTTSLMGLSVYAMFRCLCKRKDRAGVYSLSFILANLFIGRSISASYMFRMLLINENYAGFSCACIIACVIALDVYFRTGGRRRYAALILATALTMLVTGIKAPLGLVLAGGLIGTFLLGLILRRISFKEALLPTLLCGAGFYSVFRILLALDGSNGVGGDSIIGFGKIVGVCFWKSDVTAALSGMGVPSPLRICIVFALFLVCFFTIYLLPFAVGYLRELVLVIGGKKEYDFTRVSVYASALVGFIAMMLLRYTGHSQVYFGVPTAVFAPLIAFWLFEDAEQIKNKGMSALLMLCRVWFFAVLIASSATLAMCVRDTLPAVAKHADPASRYNKYTTLSSGEYEAMMWIKDNVPEDALLATQMYKSTGGDDYSVANRWHHCHFMYSAYSVRNYYLEGSGYTFTDVEAEDRREMIKATDRLYDPANDARGDDARDMGVSYVVVTQKIYPTPDLSSEDYEKVFSNEDIDIYKVRNN